MAYSTMKDLLKATCDAIRSKDGTTASINHQDIPARIEAISGDGSSGGIIITDASAEASDIAKDKVAYVNGGERVEGELRVYNEGDAYTFPNDSVGIARMGSQIVVNAKPSSDFIARSGCNINLEINNSRFGDAELSDVVAGKFFTSSAGFNKEGEHVCNDDGSGDTEITYLEAASLSDFHYWIKTGSTSSYEEVYNSNGAGISYGSSIIQYADDITVSGNSLALVNPKEWTATSDEDEAEALLLGKYIYALAFDKFYKIHSEASIIYNSPTQYTSGNLRATIVYDINVVTSTEQSSTVVISTDSSAYPQNGEQDGFTYVYQGTLGG